MRTRLLRIILGGIEPFVGAVILAAFILPSTGFGARSEAASSFHAIFKATLPPHLRAPEILSALHMLPDQAVLKAMDADSPQVAMDVIARTDLENLVRGTLRMSNTYSETSASDIDEALRNHPLTLILVPGIFGEFIPTRGFEDVLSLPSQVREKFQLEVKAAIQAGNPSALDFRFAMRSLSGEPYPLSDVVNVGSLTDANGTTLVRVMILYTSFMSLESLGDLQAHAKIFNRRIGKYLELTGPQNLALVGYSRGTDLALEMLSQAHSQNLPWLKSVRAMIGLGGVIWGSALADDTQTPGSSMKDLIEAVQGLRNELDPDSKLKTFAAWASFGKRLAILYPKLSQKPNAPKGKDLVNPRVPTSLDSKSILSLVKLGWKQLGLTKPRKDFAPNVRRFQALIDATMSGANSLTSAARLEWWKKNELPKSLTYYAITAAMANPENGPYEAKIFDNNFGYSHRSYDDLTLLQNRLDYEKLTNVSLNDSQVSVAQAMFLPNAIAKLNPANAGLKTEMLGTLGTHHWGLALRIVNQMKDGRMNPFPRESLLKALAAKVVIDSAPQNTFGK